MPLDLSDQALHILPQPTPYHLLQYPPETQIPLSLFTNPTYAFASVIKTPEEISVVVSSSTEDASKLTTIDGLGEARESDGPWVALRVQGPMELTMTGVMNELTKPFVEGKIAVFALSTWNTDYLLIPWKDQERGLELLRSHGWTVATSATCWASLGHFFLRRNLAGTEATPMSPRRPD